MPNKQLFLFSQIGYRRTFYYGGAPGRVWLKVSDTEAILTGPGTTGERVRVSPNVLVFPVATFLQ